MVQIKGGTSFHKFGSVLTYVFTDDFPLSVCAIIFVFYMNNPEIIPKIFTPQEQNENEERKRELIELVASGEAVLLVGAGSSKRVGYPDWRGLLKDLEDLTNEFSDSFEPDKRKREKFPLKYAEEIKLHVCQSNGLKKYHTLLRRLLELGPDLEYPPFEKLHKTLVSLPFRGILTTNYDIVLEAALADITQSPVGLNSLIVHEDFEIEVNGFIRAVSDQSRPRRIAHLHGRYDLPKSIILTSKDYEEAYGFVVLEETSELKNSQGISHLELFNADSEQKNSQPTLHGRLLSVILTTRRLVFVGFSMDDPYFEKMLKTVSMEMTEWGTSTHFAIMGISPKCAQALKTKAKKRKNDYGVDTVFYKVCCGSDNPHQGLDCILDEIGKECKVGNQPEIDDVE